VRKNVKLTLSTGWLLLCLAALPLCLFGQAQTPPPSATPTAPSAPQAPAAAPTPETTPPAAPSVLAPPKYTLNNVNNGMGLSIEPILFQPYGHPMIHTGDYNTTLTPGNLLYPGNPDRSFTGNIVVPVGKGGDVRFSYFQTTVTSGTVASADLNFFGNAVSEGDPLGTQAKISSYKVSYDFVTYFWNHKNGDLRLKTLYEFQYLSIDNIINDFQPQTDGTFNLNPIEATKSISAPTFGLGLDQTLGKHFRWEARGSGWALPHRSKIGDTEVNIAARYGYVEVVAGARAFYFRTTRRADHYVDGLIYGPYVGLRLYWKKR
jgi:hypothetical protein